jgi:putative exosortase-associated protein (TIGR04073 family)
MRHKISLQPTESEITLQKTNEHLRLTNQRFMRKTLPFLAAIAVAGALATGCANTEKKFGRGMTNFVEPLRMGEMRRSLEQTGLFDGPDAGYGAGFIRGLNRTLARTGVGIYEMVTAPLPPYDPVWTSYLSPSPVYPDNYMPNLVEDSTFATDINLGFSGGDVMPLAPGSRFRIFDTH